jgi:hypothetical protein
MLFPVFEWFHSHAKHESMPLALKHYIAQCRAFSLSRHFDEKLNKNCIRYDEWWFIDEVSSQSQCEWQRIQDPDRLHDTEESARGTLPHCLHHSTLDATLQETIRLWIRLGMLLHDNEQQCY